ncbi:MAG: fructosamine kinase family protein, partial [Myxococcales bacterium]|nr:fructosamine kinase family protein [Myxococcales bacterium]
MKLEDALARAIEDAVGGEIVDSTSLAGGDIHRAFRVELRDRAPIFVKTSGDAPGDMFEAEARGLEWLREARALRLPEVLAHSGGGDTSPPFLALEFLEPGKRATDFDDALGHALATLHRSGAPSFGLDHGNYIGRLPQDNRPAPSWAEFYVLRRLEPQLRRAVDSHRVSAFMKRSFALLFGRIEARVGDPEPPARLHGDLWGGNLHVGPRGEPCLIDPAVYGGHREMDLAMMKLFGGFSERVFGAYRDTYPLGDGFEERVGLC